MAPASEAVHVLETSQNRPDSDFFAVAPVSRQFPEIAGTSPGGVSICESPRRRILEARKLLQRRPQPAPELLHNPARIAKPRRNRRPVRPLGFRLLDCLADAFEAVRNLFGGLVDRLLKICDRLLKFCGVRSYRDVDARHYS